MCNALVLWKLMTRSCLWLALNRLAPATGQHEGKQGTPLDQLFTVPRLWGGCCLPQNSATRRDLLTSCIPKAKANAKAPKY